MVHIRTKASREYRGVFAAMWWYACSPSHHSSSPYPDNSGRRHGPASPGSRDLAGDGFGIGQLINMLCGQGKLFRVFGARTDDR